MNLFKLKNFNPNKIMKKFYSFMIASAVTISAFAGGAADKSPNLINRLTPRAEKNYEVSVPEGARFVPVNKYLTSFRKADGVASIEGWWTLSLGDFYDENQDEPGVISISFSATADGSTVTFTPQDDSERFFEFKGEFDAENLTLTLNKTYLSIIGGYYVFQVPYHYNFSTSSLDELDTLVGEYDVESNNLVFPTDCGLSWSAYTELTADSQSFVGDFAILDIVEGYRFNPMAANEGDWNPIGNLTFHDGWLVPALGPSFADQNDYLVPFEQNEENPYRYRLLNPYLYGPVAPYNASEGGYIVFDISDPDHVVFLPSDAGFENKAIMPGGITSFYCYNALGYEMVNNPSLSIEEILVYFDYIPLTTFKDNTVTLGSVSNQNEKAYDANFGYQSSPLGGNFWDGVDMTASITFPSWFSAGIGSAVEEPNEKVEFFDLNGLRINNPSKGQLVIKRCGSKVEKIITK